MTRTIEDDDTLPLGDAFTKKLNEIDFDPFGNDEDDGSARRRDPLRRPAGFRLQDDLDEA